MFQVVSCTFFKFESSLDLAKTQTEIDQQYEYLIKKAINSNHLKFANRLSTYRVNFNVLFTKSIVLKEYTGRLDLSDVVKIKD